MGNTSQVRCVTHPNPDNFVILKLNYPSQRLYHAIKTTYIKCRLRVPLFHNILNLWLSSVLPLVERAFVMKTNGGTEFSFHLMDRVNRPYGFFQVLVSDLLYSDCLAFIAVSDTCD